MDGEKKLAQIAATSVAQLHFGEGKTTLFCGAPKRDYTMQVARYVGKGEKGGMGAQLSGTETSGDGAATCARQTPVLYEPGQLMAMPQGRPACRIRPLKPAKTGKREGETNGTWSR
jgi:hypothetical protein